MFDILLSASAYALIIVVGAVCSHTGFIKSETKNGGVVVCGLPV